VDDPHRVRKGAIGQAAGDQQPTGADTSTLDDFPSREAGAANVWLVSHGVLLSLATRART
jgi:hypothetical protein